MSNSVDIKKDNDEAHVEHVTPDYDRAVNTKYVHRPGSRYRLQKR